MFLLKKSLGIDGLARRQLLLSGAGAALAACSNESSTTTPTGPESRTTARLVQATPMLGAATESPDIVIAAGLIPGLVNSSTDGAMVDLIKAMADTYRHGLGVGSVLGAQGGSIAIKAMMLSRMDVELVEGMVDMAMPYIRMRAGDDAQFNYRFTRQDFGKVAFVLYSRKAAPVTVAALKEAAAQQPFPYKVESADFDWGFPVSQFLDFGSAFRKLVSGHIDAFLWAQEEADEELRRIGEKGIVRELFGVFDGVFAVPRGPRGDFVEKVYDQILDAMRRSGRLKALNRKIHLPFNPWQP